MNRALDLASTFVVIDPDHSATPFAVTPTIFEELDRRFDQFKGRLLVSSFSSTRAGPRGKYIRPATRSCMLSGEAALVLDRNGTEEIIHLREPGAFALVPKGTWHTARTSVPTQMLFVTPGQGTDNRPIE
jgi:hypothetical protein